MTTSTDCRFCGHFVGESSDPIDSPWLRDSDYCAMISKGALVPGWSLICPLRHGFSLASHYQQCEFWSFAAEAEALIRARYGDVRVFEHGAGYSGSLTGCGTDHAHLHMVPLAFSLTTEALRYDATLKWKSCRASEIAAQAAGHEYLFVSDRFEGANTAGLLCLLEAPISQFFRRVVALRLGLRQFYDYRLHPMLEIAHRSTCDLHSDVLARGRVVAQ